MSPSDPSERSDGTVKTGEAKRRGRGRPATAPEELRARLIDAAERCFERAPFEEVGIMDVVREAHMSSRSFYRFFENKEDVAVALARERADAFLVDMQTIVDTADSSLEIVDRMLMAYLRDLPLVVADLQRVPPATSKRIQGLLEEYRQRIAAIILGQIGQAMQNGLVDSLPDSMAIALVLAGIEHMSIRFNTERRREDLVAMHPQILNAVRTLFPDFVSADQKIR